MKEASLIHNSFIELTVLPKKAVPATSGNLFTYQMTIAIGNTVLRVGESTLIELLSRVLEVISNA